MEEIARGQIPHQGNGHIARACRTAQGAWARRQMFPPLAINGSAGRVSVNCRLSMICSSHVSLNFLMPLPPGTALRGQVKGEDKSGDEHGALSQNLGCSTARSSSSYPCKQDADKQRPDIAVPNAFGRAAPSTAKADQGRRHAVQQQIVAAGDIARAPGARPKECRRWTP